METIKLIICGIQGGWKATIEAEEDIFVVGTAEDGKDLLNYGFVESAMPHVILLDTQLSKENGREVLPILKESHPTIPVVILTTFTDDAYLIEAIRDGAAGYVLQDNGVQQVIAAIRQCANGQIVYPASFKTIVMKELQQDDRAIYPLTLEKTLEKLGEFSDREIELLILLTAGQTNRQISQKLFLSNGTVKNYISQLYRKLNVSNRPELMATLHRFQHNANAVKG